MNTVKTDLTGQIRLEDRHESQLEHGAALDPTPVNSMHKIRLNDAETIRMEMARLYKDMRLGRIDTQDGTRLAYVLDMVRKAHETCELQRRVEIIDQVNKIRKLKK
ncbi:MAG: hypothetical protein B7X83_01760 [Polynucleobacter sp. 17-46-58]|jgi:hypothetical protein|nr:MAG: hypothetical protein B7Y22_00860 [Polynucleobacter sp. 16-46-70]OZA41629.1 MAG: hypothetical protein B7X83_01760 [Polynucleobacter sp. 17-46-58]HQR83503.1 hypothetical protein [Polynucleobacter sp.]HQT19727.1 hypothetical protein [Polynucleobacter sp.]HQT40879.1 hypothetical protein [Polynucleobacter sp.]